jgi:hypothetical protein
VEVTSVSLLVSRYDLLDPVVRRSVLSVRTAGLTLFPCDSGKVNLWILRIFDGDPSEKETKHPHEYYCEVHPSQTAEECLIEAERALRSYYGLSGWTRDASPLTGFTRSWSRKAA